MKTFALIFLVAIAFTNCKTVESQQVSNANLKTETNSAKVEIAPIQENLLKDLTKKQKEKLDESLSPKDRAILDKADEIDIYYKFNKETKGFGVLMLNSAPNSVAGLTDASLKKQFLESFYYDVAVNEGGAGCFSPRHRITAKYKNKTIEIDVCYECGNIHGKSSNDGSFGGSISGEGKSLPILSKIIEQYGTDIS